MNEKDSLISFSFHRKTYLAIGIGVIVIVSIVVLALIPVYLKKAAKPDQSSGYIVH